MTNLELINKIMQCKTRKEIKTLLDKYRIPVSKSKS